MNRLLALMFSMFLTIGVMAGGSLALAQDDDDGDTFDVLDDFVDAEDEFFSEDSEDNDEIEIDDEPENGEDDELEDENDRDFEDEFED